MGDDMEFKVGDLVTRNSYGNDVVFRITKIEDNVVILKGINMRLIADALFEDLKMYDNEDIEDEKQMDAMIRNFDMAMLHPDEKDLQGAQKFVKDIFEKIEKEEQ